MNKYYLYKKVLENNFCVSELETESAISIFGGENLTIMEAYKNRIESINQLVRTQFIEELENINGTDIISLFSQAHDIEKALSKEKYAEILIKNGHNFKEVLEDLLEVALEHIENYEKAEKLFNAGCYPKELQFLLSIYTETNNNELGDYPEECL